MPRFSQPSGTRFFCWSDNNDDYSHIQLTGNWDTIDGLFGYPNSGIWPTAGQSMYSYIVALQNAIEPVGTLRVFYQVDPSVPIPAGSGGVPTANGYVVADGSTVTVGNHSFRDGSGNLLNIDIPLPDFRNKLPLGANTAMAYGLSGGLGDGPTFAPGGAGTQGSNAGLSVNIPLKDHFHAHDHIHEVGNATGTGTDTGSTNSGDIIRIDNAVKVASGGQPIPDAGHGHNMDLYTTHPRLPDDANYKVNQAPDNHSQTNRTQTTLQKIPDPGSPGTPTDPTGGSPGDSLTVKATLDGRPATIGVFWIIKVKEVIVR